MGADVAQVSNLLYRSASSLRRFENPNILRAVPMHADWKSAIQQVGNLRHAKQILENEPQRRL
jgi:hypothetical protein